MSITSTFILADNGFSIAWLRRMQSTKYAIGLLISCGTRPSATTSPSGLVAELCDVREKSWSRVASNEPFGPNTYTRSILYGQSQDGSTMTVASGYSNTMVASSST